MNDGPVADFMIEALSEFEVFRDLRDGKITREQYVAGLEAQAAEIEARLGSRFLFNVASRYAGDANRNAAEIFQALRREGLITNGSGGETSGAESKASAAAFDALKARMRTHFDHTGHRTFIHHDEAQLVYLISMAVKPRLMVVAGAYYGYWAIWAMPGVAAAGGRAILIDPNPAVCALAEKNFRAMGYGDCTTVHAKKAEEVFPEIPAEIELALLDAAGDGKHPDPAYRGKGIYAYLAPGLWERMKPGALLVTHNDYQSGIGANRISRESVERSAAQLAPFHEYMAARCRKSHVAATPDGFGVYLK